MHCSKTVIDLTQLSDGEILRIIEKSQSSLCGRLLQTQMNRPLEMPVQKKAASKFSKVLAAFLLIFGIRSEDAFSQQVKAMVEAVEVEPYGEAPRVTEDYLPAEERRLPARVLRGRVVDNEGHPLVGAKIAVVGSAESVQADANGYFTLDVISIKISDSIKLEALFVGYQIQRLVIGAADFYEFRLVQAWSGKIEGVGGISTIKYKHKKWWQFWK